MENRWFVLLVYLDCILFFLSGNVCSIKRMKVGINLTKYVIQELNQVCDVLKSCGTLNSFRLFFVCTI